MAGNMSTLHEICVEYANKQPGMVDSLTEDAPILDVCKWSPSTHGMWNVAEKLGYIKGASFTAPDTKLPVMDAGTELVHTDLYLLGGQMEVPTMRAKKFGGPEKYLAKYQDKILRQAGMDTEIALVMNNWLKGARQFKNVRDAGGKGQGWFLLACRFDETGNCGLYDPDQFDTGRLLRIDLINGGQEYLLSSEKYNGVLGYGVAYRGAFGWQILEADRTVSAIVNIDEDNHPTADMIDDMLADVRAQAGSTYIFCGPRARIHGINPHKKDHVQLTNADKDIQTMIESWTGIPIITSHNFRAKINNIKVS